MVADSIGYALLMPLARAAAILASTSVATAAFGQPVRVRRYLWLTLLTQVPALNLALTLPSSRSLPRSLQLSLPRSLCLSPSPSHAPLYIYVSIYMYSLQRYH